MQKVISELMSMTVWLVWYPFH